MHIYRMVYTYTNARFGAREGRNWLYRLSCRGTEAFVTSCSGLSSYTWGYRTWSHSYDAGVSCYERGKSEIKTYISFIYINQSFTHCYKRRQRQTFCYKIFPQKENILDQSSPYPDFFFMRPTCVCRYCTLFHRFTGLASVDIILYLSLNFIQCSLY